MGQELPSDPAAPPSGPGTDGLLHPERPGGELGRWHRACRLYFLCGGRFLYLDPFRATDPTVPFIGFPPWGCSVLRDRQVTHRGRTSSALPHSFWQALQRQAGLSSSMKHPPIAISPAASWASKSASNFGIPYMILAAFRWPQAGQSFFQGWGG